MSDTMTAPAAPAETHRRKRAAWRPLAASAAAGSVLLVTGFGVWASLNATASATQAVSDGTLSLTGAANGVGFTNSIANMAPGDTVDRYYTLNNGGSLASKALTVKVTPTAVSPTSSNVLTTDATRGLQLTINSCSTAWTTAGVCASGSTQSVVLPSTAVAASSLQSGIALSNIGALAAAGQVYLQIVTQLPNQAETTVDGVFPANTVQGSSASLAYLFTETQRDATTTTS